MQISTNVQQTTVVVALMPAALTLQEPSRVPVIRDSTEMDTFVPVNESVVISVIKQLSHKTGYLIATCKTSNSTTFLIPRSNVETQKQRTLFIIGSWKSSYWTS